MTGRICDKRLFLPVLQQYFLRLQKLKQGTGTDGPAPHKPLLLLAIIQLIEKGVIKENKVFISAELVAAFIDLATRLVDAPSTPKFALPFYHLQGGGFWHLKTHAGMEIALTTSRSIRSFSQLKEVVAYGYFDEALWELLAQPETRSILKAALLQKYFAGRKELVAGKQWGLFDKVAQQILNEPAFVYQEQVAVADEEELFVRSGVFKRVVPKVYNHTCCISGMRLITTRSAQMVDACHIVPFSESRNDTIGNGISLCPNLHRAFDRYLISIDRDYRVRVATDLVEEGVYGFRQFEGKEILLPVEEKYRPGRENLEWHWMKFAR